MAAAGALVGRLRVPRAFVSPARRAIQTVAAMELAAEEDEALRDCDWGRWGGSSLDEIAASEPDAVALWMSDPEAAPHGGESIVALVSRVGAWMESGKVEGRVLAVTHAAVIRAAMIHALGTPTTSFWRIDAAPLSATELRWNGRQWSFRAREL